MKGVEREVGSLKIRKNRQNISEHGKMNVLEKKDYIILLYVHWGYVIIKTKSERWYDLPWQCSTTWTKAGSRWVVGFNSVWSCFQVSVIEK